jgi:hypothetical protein
VLVCKVEIYGQITRIGRNVLSFAHLKQDQVRAAWSKYLGEGQEILISESAEFEKLDKIRENMLELLAEDS